MQAAEMTPDAVLSTCELATLLRNQRGACRSNRETITRWIHRGVLVAGKRVKLAATRQGGQWLVKWSDYQQFVAACSSRATGGNQPMATPAQMRRRSEKARVEMDAIFAAALGTKRKPATVQEGKRVS